MEKMKEDLKNYMSHEKDLIANLSNFSAILFQELENVDWIGFYLRKDGELVLGPFQGKPACTRIKKGKGVCGTAWEEGKSQRIEDVREVENHIFCDNDTLSELVIPLYKEGEFVGVLDLDSHTLARFTEDLKENLEDIVSVFMEKYWQ